MITPDKNGNTVSCPLCDGHGDIEKQAAVARWRSMEFREDMRKIESSVAKPSEEETFAHYSYKD